MSVRKGSLAVISASYKDVEVFGITNDRTRLGHISFNGSAWSTWSLLGLSGDLLYKSAPSVVAALPRSFDVFITDTADNIKTRNFNGTSWRPDIGWQHMHSNIADAGSPVAMGPIYRFETARYDLHTRKTDGFELTIYNVAEDPHLFGTYNFKHEAKSSSNCIITSSSSMEMFYIGLDDYMYHFHWFDSPSYYWADEKVIGDQKFISPPTAVTNAPGRVDVFGIAPDQTVMHNSYQSSSNAWTGWEQLGKRRFTSSISAVVTRGTNNIELWGLGPDGALWHRGGDGDRWPVDWDSHRGSFISAPALISPAEGVYDVFAVGSDRTLKHARRTETPASWAPGFGVWNSLGGSLEAFA